MEYLNKNWAKPLETMGISSFDDWWELEGKSAEDGNTKAGDPSAWGYVTIIPTPSGKNIYLKREQNFYPNNLFQRWRKQLTYEREYHNYQKIRSAEIPTYELIYFASRKQGGKRQAIYVAEGLDGFNPMSEMTPLWRENGWPPREDRRRLLTAMLQTIQHMHSKGILHNALSPRHLFFNLSKEDPCSIPENIEFSLIDFERLKDLKPGSDKGIQRDLFTLYHRCLGWPTCDRIWFLKQYLGIDKLDDHAKGIIRRFIRESRRRNQS